MKVRLGKTALITGTILAAAIGSAASYVSDGHEYSLRCTADGYELTSVNTVVRTVGVGAGAQPVRGREKIYLGKSCDAVHKLFGTGEWCWANGGFRAEFPHHLFGFPRQELFCEPERDYQLNCRC